VRISGQYEKWVAFFLEGVETVSNMVIDTTRRIQQLERQDSDRLIEAGAGTDGISTLRYLMQQPIVLIQDIEKHLGKSRNTATKVINTAESLGILKQISQGKRNRKYAYQAYVNILSEGTEINPTLD
jgi:Fic family protein